jgi:hypothetical protein
MLKDGFRKKNMKEGWRERNGVIKFIKHPKGYFKEKISSHHEQPLREEEDLNEDVGEEEKKRKAKRKIIDGILASASDVQTLNGT